MIFDYSIIDMIYFTATCRLMPVSSSTSSTPNVGALTLSKNSMSLILEVSKHVCQVALDDLKGKLDEDLLEIRKLLLTPRAAGNGGPELRSLNRKLISGMNERLRTYLTHLQLFLDPELVFAVKTNFRTSYCRSAVREGVFVTHFRYDFNHFY